MISNKIYLTLKMEIEKIKKKIFKYKKQELKNQKLKIKVYKKPLFKIIKESPIEKSISPISKIENSFKNIKISSSNSFSLSSIKENIKNSKKIF